MQWLLDELEESVRGRCAPHIRRIDACRAECESLVEKRKIDEPPAALMPGATAIASSSVDSPLPFSPISTS
jgi:hypothetical protein